MLTTEELKKNVPAAFALTPASHVSEKYQFVRTIEVVNMLRDDGWSPIQAYQQKVRSDSKLETTKHVIVMRKGEYQNLEAGGLCATFRIINSHDHSSRLKMIQELMRKVCANGLMMAEQGATFSVRHDQIQQDIRGILNSVEDRAGGMFETALKWAATQLSPEQWDRWGMEAARIRFGEDATEGHARAMIRQRRTYDAGDDLFMAFNRAQEAGMRGGDKFYGMKRRTRSLTNIDAQVKFNEAIRDLASEWYTRLN